MLSQIEGYRLSPQQKRLWTIQEGNDVYRATCRLHLEGALQPERLKAALLEVINRHEILRTTLRRVPGIKVPLQVVTEAGQLAWETLDLRERVREEQEAALAGHFQEIGRLPFDYEQGPLLRSMLASLSASQHALLLCLPALYADTWTLRNLTQEIAAAYAASTDGSTRSVSGAERSRRSSDTDEVVQYVQFSEWQNELLEGEEAEQGKTYWREQDFSALDGLSLPYEIKLADRPPFDSKVFTSLIEPKVAEALAQSTTSLKASLLAAWQVLIWRLTRQSDIVVGMAFHGRKFEELESGLGLFAKWLPILSRLQAEYPFNEIVRQVNQALEGAETWQDYFLWEESLGPVSLEEGYPFAFDFETRSAQASAAGVSFNLTRPSICAERFKVKLVCDHDEKGLIAEWHFDAGLFSIESIQCLAEQYQVLLESITKNPEAAIGELGLLSPSVRQGLIVEFNATEAPYPADLCVHQLFEAQVARTPDNEAVICGDQSLTYAELNTRANQLAEHLQTLGVGPESLVAVCMERSLEMVVALLGVLKAGGAYVPLDATYPPERLAYMLEDSRARVLLTQSHLLKTPNFQIPNPKSLTTIPLDTERETLNQQSAISNLQSTTSPENLAYLIYTSGSTGQPKGVMVTHRGVINYLTWCQQAYPLDGGLGSPVHSSISFDLTVTSLFAPLVTGRRVRLLPEAFGVDRLTEALRQEADFSLIKITPAHLQLLGEHLPPELLASRTRAFIIGGENLLVDHIARWQKAAPDTALVNEYGPTETVVGCCVYWAPPGEHSTGSIPIGRPIINTELYILDEQQRPVAIGEPGELYIGGIGVGRGYLNRPELTAEKFVPNPFVTLDDEGRKTKDERDLLRLSSFVLRLYKTGDLARFRPDGNIEFLGRIDHQVKIRGFRVELGEIESTLSRHPAVQENVVLARADGHGERGAASLVAYVVVRRGESPTDTELRNFLAEKLPEHMLPTTIVRLPTLPLTSNGKVDRRALPAPDSSRPNLEQVYIAPRTPVEETLATIWSQVLGVEKIGVQDNFFELGGHSLLATQVVSRVREAFQVEVPLPTLIETPTISGLAEQIETIRWAAETTAAPEGHEDGEI
jgi:amino acid adenylation domain-containing protein